MIQSGSFQHIYHIGCAFNLHSIINNGLIPGGQNSGERQTVFFLPIDPRDKEHKDPKKIDLIVPRRAQYLHNAWKRHQDAVYWVDINLSIRKGLTSITLDRMQSSFKEHFQPIVFYKAERSKTGEKSYMRKHTCHLDHHQRSRYVTIGLKKRVRFYWALKIDNHKKKLLDKQNSSNQPNQSQNQSVIDQGNLIERKT